jgi:hypothetical protein
MGLQSVIGVAKGLGDALGLGLANELEQTRARFNAFTKDAGLTEQILAKVRSEADKTPFSFREMASATASLIPAAKQSGEALEGLMKTAQILAASNPLEGLEGASFALREAISGDMTSIVERFNLSRSAIKAYRDSGVSDLEAVRMAMRDMGLDADLVAGMAQTAAGRWSTFMDAIDSVRLKVSQPIFEALSAQLVTLASFLDANSAQVAAFGQSFGTALAGGVQTAAGVLQAVWPTLVEVGRGLAIMGEGIGNAIQGFQSFSAMLGDIPMAVAGVGLAVGALALAIGGLPALILIGVGALAVLLAKMDEYIQKKLTFESDTGFWDAAKQSAADYTAQISRLNAEQTTAAAVVDGLVDRFAELQGELQTAGQTFGWQSEQVQRITQEMIGLDQAAHRAFGINLVADTDAAGKATAGFTGTIREAVGQISLAGTAAGKMDPIVKKLQEITSNAEDAFKAIRAITNPPTGGEIQVAAQLDTITAAQKNLAAATTTTGKVSQDFAGQTQEWLNKAGLAPDVLGRALDIIREWEKGNLTAAQAQKAFKEALDPTVATLENVKDGLGSSRQAIGSLSEAEAAAARDWGGSMEGRKEAAREMVDVIVGKFPEIPAAAGEAAGAMNQRLLGEFRTAQVEASATGDAIPANLASGISAGSGQAVGAADAMMDSVGAALESGTGRRRPARTSSPRSPPPCGFGART